MLKRRGIVIYAHEATDYWAARLEQSGLNVVGLHPVGGAEAPHSLERCIQMLSTPEFARFHTRMERAGIAVEYEMHALAWLLERERFSEHPEWFRMDERGVRRSDFACCASSAEGLAYLSERTAQLARIFRPDTGSYHFWTDDVDAFCCCDSCRALSPADQALRIYNAIAEGVAAANRSASQSFLAYVGALAVPQVVRPRNNIFLEFAPFRRTFDCSLFDPTCEQNRLNAEPLPALLDFFGRQNAKVLDYWTDNSMFSGWKLPPRRFQLNDAVCREDVRAYRRLGFDSITAFGCYLGEEYRDLYGDADLSGYMAILAEP